jgi:DNA primase
MAFYPRETLDELKKNVSLVDIISKDTNLVKNGNIYMGNCPFPERHEGKDDSDPSFRVYPAGTRGEYDNFYCFGCHVGDKKETGYGSDIFEYFRLRYGLSLGQSIEKVASLAGIHLEQSEKSRERDLLYAHALSQNRDFYRSLMKSPKALEYLSNRGISKESIDKWRLGYVHDGFASKFLRNRIAIPILDLSGRACGFGFRSIGEEKPKYINSSESSIFLKKNLWYGLYQAKQKILQEGYAILVEGYMDVILLHQVGVENAISSMGTAVNNLDILKRYTNTVVVWTDGDKAGRKSADKYIEELNDKGFVVKVVDLGHSLKDPAEISLEYGDNTLDYITSNTVYAKQYQISKELDKLRSEIMNAKLRTLPTIIGILKLVNNQQELDLYLEWVSRDLGITVDSLMSKVID